MQTPPERFGAYGLTITGIKAAKQGLGPALRHWPELHLDQARMVPTDDRAPFMDAERAFLRVGRNQAIAIEREQRRATVLSPSDRGSAELIHPFLSVPAATFARWEERAAVHGGAFVANGFAWGVFGEKHAGKSTALAALALEGVPIVTDDLVIVDRGLMLAGPRQIDLRPGAARQFALPPGLETVRRRLRLTPTPSEPEVPVGGWIFLKWGRPAGLRRLDRREALVRLAGQYVLAPALGPSPVSLLELACYPALELRRPRSFAAIAQTTRWLAALDTPPLERSAA